MAECRWCERNGASVTVDARGLCDLCAPELALRIDTETRRLQRSVRLAEQTSRVTKQLQRWLAVQEHANRLEQIEGRGIEVSNPPPAHYLEMYRRSRDRIINEDVRRDVDGLLAEAAQAVSTREALAIGSRAAALVRDAKRSGGSSRTLRELELRVRNAVHGIQIGEFLTKARKAERLGRRKQALEHYQGALYFLLHDDIDDRVQRHDIEEVRAKVASLAALV